MMILRAYQRRCNISILGIAQSSDDEGTCAHVAVMRTFLSSFWLVCLNTNTFVPPESQGYQQDKNDQYDKHLVRGTDD